MDTGLVNGGQTRSALHSGQIPMAAAVRGTDGQVPKSGLGSGPGPFGMAWRRFCPACLWMGRTLWGEAGARGHWEGGRGLLQRPVGVRIRLPAASGLEQGLRLFSRSSGNMGLTAALALPMPFSPRGSESPYDPGQEVEGWALCHG